MSWEHFVRWTCDGCGKKEEAPDYPSLAPEGWLRVSIIAPLVETRTEVALIYCRACGPKDQRDALDRFMKQRKEGRPHER